ncbi:MAG: hypothetical protein HYY59_03720 [Candidatus Omnitrophica bacterium]|nr:hypothetical protein [Candidatus Omnitrophota bacterium]
MPRRLCSEGARGIAPASPARKLSLRRSCRSPSLGSGTLPAPTPEVPLAPSLAADGASEKLSAAQPRSVGGASGAARGLPWQDPPNWTTARFSNMFHVEHQSLS